MCCRVNRSELYSVVPVQADVEVIQLAQRRVREEDPFIRVVDYRAAVERDVSRVGDQDSDKPVVACRRVREQAVTARYSGSLRSSRCCWLLYW